MNYITKAYVWAICGIATPFLIQIFEAEIVSNFLYLYDLDVSLGGTFSLIISILFFAKIGANIKRDALSRNLSSKHFWWAGFSILGVLIYHLGFARNNKVKKK
jgi:hypothetical protein